MALSRSKKSAILDDVSALLEKSTALVFVKNNGLNVDEVNELRASLRKENAKMKITKKTILKIALKNQKFPEAGDAVLDGPIGVTFCMGDQVSPVKALAEFAKKHDKLELMGAILDGDVLDQAKIIALSKLPSKQELLGKFVYVAKSPISGFHGVLHGVMRGMVQVLDQIKQKKESEA